jgi:RNA polymerase sigma-70 factor (ECF subfamily)
MENSSQRVSQLDDLQLVQSARVGDQEAFGELVERHYQRCVSLAASILRDQGEAEEEAQNACWKAFAHLYQFHGESEFSTWLFRIVKNQCLMLIRRRRGVQFIRLDDRGPEEAGQPMELYSSAEDPEGELGRQEVGQVLQNEIRRIPPLLRQALMLRDVDQLPMPELADQLGITVAAAKSRLLRARTELRLRMLRHCGKTGARSLMAETSIRKQRVFHQYSKPAA